MAESESNDNEQKTWSGDGDASPIAHDDMWQRQRKKRLERKTVEGWLTASEQLDDTVSQDSDAHKTRDTVQDLEWEVAALSGLNKSLNRLVGHSAAAHADDSYSADEEELIQWLREHYGEMQAKLDDLAAEIETDAEISDGVRQELLDQYMDAREELELLGNQPERAATALEMVRDFIRNVAHHMKEVVVKWLPPLLRVLIPLATLASGHVHLHPLPQPQPDAHDE